MAETQNNDFNQPILNLTAQEKAAYAYLFKLADVDSLGVLTGERAVSFFEKTRVPAPVLGEIWQIADTENRGLLTKPGFCIVLRLIGYFQAGEQPRPELAFRPGPLPKFDGISIPAADLPAQQRSPSISQQPPTSLQPQLSGQSTGGGPIRIPPLDPGKVQQYSGLFERSGAQNGMLDGFTAKSIFERSGLPNEMLGKIWMLSDREQRGSLDQTEFVVAMHLLTSVKTRAMTALPNTLPAGLYEAAARRGQRPPSRQTSIQAATIPRQFSGAQPQRAQSPLARSTPQMQSAMVTGPHWLITAQEKAQYDRFFTTIDTTGTGVVTGDQAVRFFSDSRLPEETLASIWDLADIRSEGQLNRDEFAVAMYLIRQQRQPNAPPLPAFLPSALIPPTMRGQQQPPPHSTAPAFENVASAPPSLVPKSAAEDLFGLDEPTKTSQPVLQPQSTGASVSRDPFAGTQPVSPSSPQRFQSPAPIAGNTTFKPFVPTSAFGASIAQQPTGGSAASASPTSRGLPPQQLQQQPSQQQAPQSMSGTMDDLLGENAASAAENSRMTDETAELANMSNQIGNLRAQMEQTQTKKSATQADLAATDSQKRDLETRLQQFRAQYETEVRTVKDLEQQLTASRESTKKLGQELAMLEGTHQDLQSQHNTVSQALLADQQENASLKQRIGQINAEVARLKPEIEKLKLDARQQKGLASINKKQLVTNEGDRDRLQSEKADLEREAAEAQTISSEPVSQSRDVASQAPSTLSSTNPFFRKASDHGLASPSAAPTPSAFDAIFGPSSAFAPTGQASSRAGTPPATSFIGRTLPNESTTAATAGGVIAGGLAAVGLGSLADSVSSARETSSAATPPVGERSGESAFERSATPSLEPPPPPVSRQFSASNLPITSLASGDGSDAASSVQAVPPASRAGDFETPAEPIAPAPVHIDSIPGAFPDDQAFAAASTNEVAPSPDQRTPLAAPSRAHDEFDSAFASFGEQPGSGHVNDDPFAPTAERSGPQTSGFGSEFPPIEHVEADDDSDSDSEAGERGFNDNFAPVSQSRDLEPTPDESWSNEAPVKPPVASGNSAGEQLPSIDKQTSPPIYDQSYDALHGGPGIRKESDNFPPEFTGLLPAREDPTSPPPPTSSVAAESAFAPSAEPVAPTNLAAAETSAPSTLDPFHNGSSQAEARPVASTNAFDEFDDFDDLAEAHEHQHAGDGTDLDFGRQSVDEFNPAFDSPSASTSIGRGVQPISSSSNGFANFTPSASTASAFGSTDLGSGGSIQHTPTQTTSQHDWDAIFSGLDNGDGVDTTFSTASAATADPWAAPAPAASTNGTAPKPVPTNTTTSTSARPELGRALTLGTEHDDPILKRLTGMGYPRTDALRALESCDYDINRAVDLLASR